MGVVNDTKTGTLAAATPASVTFDVDLQCRTASFVLKNTGGANAIGTITFAVSNDNATFVTLTSVSIASIAFGAATSVDVTDFAERYAQFTMTSAAGSTYEITMRAVSS